MCTKHVNGEWDAINFNVLPLHGLNKFKFSALFHHFTPGLSAVDRESLIRYTIYRKLMGVIKLQLMNSKCYFTFHKMTYDILHTKTISQFFIFPCFSKVFRVVTKESSSKVIYYVNRLIYANLCPFHYYPSVSVTSAKLSTKLKSYFSKPSDRR